MFIKSKTILFVTISFANTISLVIKTSDHHIIANLHQMDFNIFVSKTYYIMCNTCTQDSIIKDWCKGIFNRI